mmetsp:Transcript_11770/g.16829  ORF Transcript_11770/g.16829 Transcript_11770/m.16829 type:complete len:85 (+) Transcript_11770:419-673(+)
MFPYPYNEGNTYDDDNGCQCPPHDKDPDGNKVQILLQFNQREWWSRRSIREHGSVYLKKDAVRAGTTEINNSRYLRGDVGCLVV